MWTKLWYFTILYRPVNQEDSPFKIVGGDIEYTDEKILKNEKSEDYLDEDLICNDDFIDGDAEDEAEDDLDDMDLDDDCPADDYDDDDADGDDDDDDDDDDEDDFGNDFEDGKCTKLLLHELKFKTKYKLSKFYFNCLNFRIWLY